MLSQILRLSPRRLFMFGLIIAALLLGILLIIFWQVGLFDSAPPPATIEAAVQSVRQEQQAQQAQQQEDEPAEAVAQSQSAPASQQQEDAAADPGSQQEQPTPTDDPQQAASSDDAQERSEPDQDAENQPASQDAQTQQTQQAQQEAMTPEAPALADLAGTWVLSEQGVSFVGYRIGEELANIGTTTAVGRTGDVEVALEFDGAAITAVAIEADLRTLQSDQSFRDSALRTRGIETDTYPFAAFVLTEPIPIDALPTAEETLSATVQGTLDLHGVTNPVSIALEGQYVDGLVVVVGSTEIALADYDIEPPTGFRVLSIEDVGVMEFQLVLEPAP